jgi:hypothetical protein
MKIGTVLTATDLNPLYSGFIPIFISAWKKLIPEADVIIVLIADTIPEEFIEYKEHIRLFSPIPGIHTAFQAQCIRILYPRVITRNEGVLISDMDMIPLNRSYYVDPVQKIPGDHFVTYRDVCLPYGEIAICYNIAHPNIWKDMIGHDSMESLLLEWHKNTGYSGVHGGTGWSTDQQILLKKFNGWNGPKITLNDTITKYSRLDRIHPLKFSNLSVLKQDIATGQYSDYHCIRPYQTYKQINDYVVACISQFHAQ